jgi:tripartite-type tricarboxylate transporter receptor subunit TctC
MNKKVMFFLLSVLLVVFLIPRNVLCSDYPTREIELISGFGPGSSNDSTARLVARFGEKYVGKPIVVVNKAGGGGTRGYSFVASGKPDGYTLGNISTGMIFTPYLMKGVTYHYKKNFKAICQTSLMPIGLYVRKGSPYDVSLKELVKMAKAKPNTIKVGIGGTWVPEDMARALMDDVAGIQCIRVPFSGGGTESVPALLGGHTDINYGGSAHWAELYRAGKLNVLGITQDKRDPRFPDIPTFKESGYDLTGLVNYYWIAAPANTPDAIVNFLAEAFRKGFAEQGYIDGMSNLGCTAAWEGPAGAVKAMDRLDEMVRQVVKKYDLKPE